MPFGKRNTRRFSIKDAGFLPRFLGLLRQELQALRELEGLQAEALACLNQGAFSGLMDLVQKQTAVQERVVATRAELAPLVTQFGALPEDDKARLREQGVAQVLGEIETVANAIHGRHQGAFPEAEAGGANAVVSTSASGAEDKSASDQGPRNPDEELQARLAIFRGSA